MRKPPKGFRGVFLWTQDPARYAAGVPIPSDRLIECLTAVTSSAGPGPTPVTGVVVLGRWLGAKPGDSGWVVDRVESVDTGFAVVLDSGALTIEVRQPGGAVLAPGPYGDLLVIPRAQDVVVAVDGSPPEWLPSVRAGQAYDMRGIARRWPRRKAPGRRSPLARTQPVPALMLSVWNARPLPAGLTPPRPE